MNKQIRLEKPVKPEIEPFVARIDRWRDPSPSRIFDLALSPTLKGSFLSFWDECWNWSAAISSSSLLKREAIRCIVGSRARSVSKCWSWKILEIDRRIGGPDRMPNLPSSFRKLFYFSLSLSLSLSLPLFFWLNPPISWSRHQVCAFSYSRNLQTYTYTYRVYWKSWYAKISRERGQLSLLWRFFDIMCESFH